MFLNYCYWICKHTQVFFLPDCSYKICEKPTKSAICVCVVDNFGIVNDYADIVSVLSIAILAYDRVGNDYFGICPRSR